MSARERLGGMESIRTEEGEDMGIVSMSKL